MKRRRRQWLGSARWQRAGDGLLPSRTSEHASGNSECSQPTVYELKIRFARMPKPARYKGALPRFGTTILVILATAACRRGMVDQPHLKPLAEENFFADGAASRVPPPHTVARGELHDDDQFFTGKTSGYLVATMPVPVTREMLDRGRERFDIFCAVCHGRTGEGNGMIVQRGFPQPPSFHDQRLRDAPVGHFFDVITNGYGVMYPYASRVTPADRWAIIAYIRALQLSENAKPGDADATGAKQLETVGR